MTAGGGQQYSFEGEVTRRLEEITLRMESLAQRMEQTYVRFDLFEASKQLQETERLQLSKRVENLESRSEWIVRTVGGIIITAVLGVVVTLAKAKTGV